jgi:hypothetical protein
MTISIAGIARLTGAEMRAGPWGRAWGFMLLDKRRSPVATRGARTPNSLAVSLPKGPNPWGSIY